MKVAKVSDLKPGQGMAVFAGEREIGLFNVDGKFYAIDNICKHQRCPLSDGFLDGKILTCSCHGWMYDVTTGQGLTMPVKEEKFNVKIEGEDVLIEV